MEENLPKKKSNKLFATILLTVVLVVAVVGVYVYTQTNQPKPAEKATPVTNFIDGSWANYTATFYEDSQGYPGAMMTYTISGTFKNQACWVYCENLTWTDTNGSWVEVDTYYLDKSSYQSIGQTCQITQNGAAYSEDEFTGEDMSNDYARFSNMTIVSKDASVKVPKGTFTCTEQQGTIYSASQQDTFDVTVWVKSDIPNWGIVKYVFNLDGAPNAEFLLESYGS
jgi:hypothetical protein